MPSPAPAARSVPTYDTSTRGRAREAFTRGRPREALRDTGGRFMPGGPGGPGGRPAWTDPGAFAEAVAHALEHGGHMGGRCQAWGQLARALGFAGREGLRRYEARPGFRLPLARARLAMAERHAASRATQAEGAARWLAAREAGAPPRLLHGGRPGPGFHVLPSDTLEALRERATRTAEWSAWATAEAERCRARVAQLEAEDGPS